MVVVCHLNARSLVAPGRLAELSLLTSIHGIDVLCITETWLKPKHLNSTISIPGFQLPFRLDRPQRKGGGVAVYLKMESPLPEWMCLHLALNVSS